MGRVLGIADFNKEKLKNAREMYETIKEAYTDVGHEEVAVVFLAKGHDYNRACIYDTEKGAYERVRASKRDDEAYNPFHKINILEALGKLKENAKRVGYSKFCTTVIHNHTNASSFNFIDLQTFMEEDSMIEIYLDTSRYIYWLIKNQKRWTNTEVDGIEDCIKEMIGIVRGESRKFIGQMILSTLLENQENSEAVKPEDIRNQLSEPADDVHFKALDRLWDEIDKSLGSWINRVRISKKELEACI
ncbi:MAG: hypothetical protein FWC13_13510 [Oscillospiraceae bacterium]|nr:hypothetical protein [Oscillospiraceae bacterium]